MGREDKQAAPAYPRDLDAVDRQILRLLRDDGRRPNAEIARALSVSEPTVRKRLDRLRESGVLKIIGVLDPSATGFPVYAMIGLRVVAGRGPEIGLRLAGMDRVANVTFITGRWDIWIEVMLPSNMHLHDFLGDDLTDIGGIVSAETFLVLAIEKFNYTWDLPDPDAPTPPAPSSATPATPATPSVAPVETATTGPGESQEEAPAADARPRRAEPARELDAMDRQILRLLQDDGRRPNADIARALGVSEPTVRKRLDRLLESGVLHIIGLLDPAATGFPVDVFVGIKVNHGHARRVGQHLAEMGCVTFVGYTTGPFDMLIEAVFADNAALLTFLSESVGSAPGVVSTETIHILRVDKFKYMWDLPEASDVPEAGGRGAAALTSWTQGRGRGRSG